MRPSSGTAAARKNIVEKVKPEVESALIEAPLKKEAVSAAATKKMMMTTEVTTQENWRNS